MSTDSGILLTGVGGNGVNTLARLSRCWADPPTHAAVDTDRQTLDRSGLDRCLLLGRSLTDSMGAGGDVDIGRQCAEADNRLLLDMLTGRSLLLLVAGLGGGTGTGVAPMLAERAAEHSVPVIAFVSMPFYFEGAGKRKAAEKGLMELKKRCDAVVILPNQRVFDWVGEQQSVEEAFALVDRLLLHTICLFCDVLTTPGLLNLTLNDLRALARHSGGTLVMGYGEGHGPEKAADAFAHLVKNPVLGGEAILPKAAGLMIGLLGGEDLALREVQMVVNSITELTRNDVHLFVGTALRSDWADRMAVAVLATEQWMDEEEEEPLPADTPAEEAEQETPRGKRSRKKASKSRLVSQGAGEGRFKNVEPTMHEGTDLDIPTFRRKGIQLMP